MVLNLVDRGVVLELIRGFIDRDTSLMSFSESVSAAGVNLVLDALVKGVEGLPVVSLSVGESLVSGVSGDDKINRF